MAGGRHQFCLLKAQRLQIPAQHLRHFPDPHVLRTDRRLPDPALQLRHVAVQVRVDVRIDGRVITGVGRDRCRVERLLRLKGDALAGRDRQVRLLVGRVRRRAASQTGGEQRSNGAGGDTSRQRHHQGSGDGFAGCGKVRTPAGAPQCAPGGTLDTRAGGEKAPYATTSTRAPWPGTVASFRSRVSSGASSASASARYAASYAIAFCRSAQMRVMNR